jgi:hypothetical protein
MQKTLGGHLSGQDLLDYLESNSMAVENMRYFKAHEADEGVQLRSELSDVSIKIFDIELEQKDIVEEFKYRLKPLKNTKTDLLLEIKENGKFVEEGLYKMIEYATNEVGYYNKDGHLVSTRPMRPEEKQRNIFKNEKYEVREAI